MSGILDGKLPGHEERVNDAWKHRRGASRPGVDEQDHDKFPATDGWKPVNDEQWAKHFAHVRQVNARQREEIRNRQLEEKQKAEEEWRQAKEAELKEDARRRYKATGGTDEEFEEAWPAILADYRSRAAAREIQQDRPGSSLPVRF